MLRSLPPARARLPPSSARSAVQSYSSGRPARLLQLCSVLAAARTFARTPLLSCCTLRSCPSARVLVAPAFPQFPPDALPCHLTRVRTACSTWAEEPPSLNCAGARRQALAPLDVFRGRPHDDRRREHVLIVTACNRFFYTTSRIAVPLGGRGVTSTPDVPPRPTRYAAQHDERDSAVDADAGECSLSALMKQALGKRVRGVFMGPRHVATTSGDDRQRPSRVPQHSFMRSLRLAASGHVPPTASFPPRSSPRLCRPALLVSHHGRIRHLLLPRAP